MIHYRYFKFSFLIILIVFLNASIVGVQAQTNTTPSSKTTQKSSTSQTKSTKKIVVKIITPNLYGKTKTQAGSILKKRGLKTGGVVYVTR